MDALIYFEAREFACACCGLNVMDPEVGRKLDAIRRRLGMPILVTSACRCAAHNAAVNGKPGSRHVPANCREGAADAVDVRCADMDALLAEMRKEFRGIGDGRHLQFPFIHGDLGPKRKWGY